MVRRGLLNIKNNMDEEKLVENKILSQMLAMLADQWYHQPGDNITINRMVLADMLTKQTMHGIHLGKEEEMARWSKLGTEIHDYYKSKE